MTTPPPPAPPQPPPPAPPAPPEPPPPTPPAPPEDAAASVARLEATVAQLRREARDREAEMARLRQGSMTDAEKAIEAAKEEGRREAAAQHARDLAAAEFRAAAAGRLANPEGALAALNLDALVKDGKPDTKAIGALVDQLAAVPPPPGRVPPGPMPPAPDGQRDWLRDIQRTR